MAIAQELDDIVQREVNKFQSDMQQRGEVAWRNSRADLKKMDVDDEDKIVPSSANRDIISDVNRALVNSLSTQAFAKAVAGLKAQLEPMAELTINHYNDKHGDVSGSTISQVKGLVTTISGDIDNELSFQAFNDEVVNPIIDKLAQHMTGRSTISAMLTDMEYRLVNRIRTFSQLRAETSLQIFARRVNDIVSSGFDLVWIKYDGPKDDRNRQFCSPKAGKYFHVNEVREWPANEAPWDGMIPNTDRGSIFVLAGGFACRHTFVYVEQDKVPQDVISRQ